MNAAERNQLILEITSALKIHIIVLSDDEQRWVQMAIKKEAQSIAFRNAVIEKSIISLLAMFGAGVFYVFVDFLKNHGFK